MLDKKLMGREMLSMKRPKQVSSEKEEIVLEQRPTVQVKRARAFRSMLHLLLQKRKYVFFSSRQSLKIELNSHVVKEGPPPSSEQDRHAKGFPSNFSSNFRGLTYQK